ncbi:MAG: glycosyltransferase family 4 protein [Acidimicrobiia bacterium]
MDVAVIVEASWHRVPGGTAVATNELLRALGDRDDVRLLGVSARHRRPAPEPWPPPVPVRALPLPRLALYEAWHGPRPAPAVERATGPVDVVHATAIAYPASRAPVVVTVNDLAFLHDDSYATGHGARFFRRGTELARLHARLVIVPSQATWDDCVAAGFDAGRLRQVPYGTHPATVTAEEVERVRRQYRLEAPYVLFAGTVEPRKNLRRLAEAFGRVAAGRDEVTLVMAGPDGWNEELAPIVAGLGQRARPLGFVPRGDLDALLAGAAVVAYPSLREGFGLPVLEAMAHGAPVVTSLGTSTEEVAGDAAVLVDPLDVDAIAGALESLLADPERAAALGRAGRERAAAYTWARTAAMTADVYEEAIG